MEKIATAKSFGFNAALWLCQYYVTGPTIAVQDSTLFISWFCVWAHGHTNSTEGLWYQLNATFNFVYIYFTHVLTTKLQFLNSKKSEVFPVQARKTNRGRRATVPLILNLGTRRGWMVRLTLRPLYPDEKICYPFNWKLPPPPGAGINFLEMKKTLVSTGIRNSESKHVAQSLYRLR